MNMGFNGDKTVVIVAGPTASGKTAAAIRLAQHWHTSIISADSRQCYRELNIGVARPSAEELAAVPHYFIASHSIHEPVNAAGFEAYALQKASEIFQEKDIVVMVGGTGLYIKAFCEGLDEVPGIDPGIRAAIITAYQQKGLGWLQQQVKEEDPVYFANGEIQNPQRLMRVLEVKRGTGQSIRLFQKGDRAMRPFRVVKLGIDLPREELFNRIDRRVDQMIEQGLTDEVKDLRPYRHLVPLQTVGYTELFDHLLGNITLQKAIELIKTNTRRYARRQLTWFRKDKEIAWVAPDAISPDLLLSTDR